MDSRMEGNNPDSPENTRALLEDNEQQKNLREWVAHYDDQIDGILAMRNRAARRCGMEERR